MVAQILNGKEVSTKIRTNIKEAITEQVKKGHRQPGLAVILLGEDPASEVYVKNKRLACEEVGILSHAYLLSKDTTQTMLLALIAQLNQRHDIDGILVQLPLPAHIDTQQIIEAIDPRKDVDGFHPYNLGRLAQFHPTLRPCTPYGIIELLQAYHLPLRGKHAVIVGASNIVGKPMALELLMAKCTVTVCHSATQNLAKAIQEAEILISATGKPHLIQSQWIQPGTIVVDVGMNRTQHKLTGDLDYSTAAEKAAWITPVPGGVGPMTVAMLLQNTYQCSRA